MGAFSYSINGVYIISVFVTGNELKLKEVRAFLGEETNPKFVLVNQELDRALA